MASTTEPLLAFRGRRAAATPLLSYRELLTLVLWRALERQVPQCGLHQDPSTPRANQQANPGTVSVPSFSSISLSFAAACDVEKMGGSTASTLKTQDLNN